MGEHARLSFSASERWLRCAASVRMIEGLNQADENNAAAEEGTIAHKWLERSLINWDLTGDETIICDDAEMGTYLQECMDYVIQRYNEIDGANKTINFEQRVDVHYISGRDDMWGKSDIIISTDDYIDVLDLKYGAGIFVEADTSQNRLYVLGKMCEYMKEHGGDMPWISVRGTIMQPRYAGTEGETIRYEEYIPEDLDSWFQSTVLPMAKMTDYPVDMIEPIAGETQCRFCMAKPTCPAAEAAIKAVCSVFEPVTEQPLLETITVADLDIARLVQIQDNAPFVTGYLSAVAERLRDLLEAREPQLDGVLKLVRSRKLSKWNQDDEDLIKGLTAGKNRVPKKLLVRETVITPVQAMKLTGLKPAQVLRLNECISKSEGSLTIVPFTDERDNAFPLLPFESQDEVALVQPFSIDSFL